MLQWYSSKIGFSNLVHLFKLHRASRCSSSSHIKPECPLTVRKYRWSVLQATVCSGVLMVLVVLTLVPAVFSPSWYLHLNAFDGLIDGFEQGPVCRVLITLFVAEHVGQSVHICIEVLFTDGLLLNKNANITKRYPSSILFLPCIILNWCLQSLLVFLCCTAKQDYNLGGIF